MIARNRPLLLSLCFFFLTISLAARRCGASFARPCQRLCSNPHARNRVNALDAQLARLEQDTGHQVAVLTLPSLDGEDIEGFSIRVAENWKIGKKGFDNGVILIVAVNDRKLRLEVGYGLEGILPDLTANRIIRDYIVPLFRSGDFAAGIVSGINAVEKVIRKEPLPESARKQAQGRGSSLNFIVMLVITFAILGLFGFSSGGESAWQRHVGDRQPAARPDILGRDRWFWRRRGFGGGGGGGFSGGGGGFGGGGSSGSW